MKQCSGPNANPSALKTECATRRLDPPAGEPLNSNMPHQTEPSANNAMGSLLQGMLSGRQPATHRVFPRQGAEAGLPSGRGSESGAAGPPGGLRPAGVRRGHLRRGAPAGGEVVRGAVGAWGQEPAEGVDAGGVAGWARRGRLRRWWPGCFLCQHEAPALGFRDWVAELSRCFKPQVHGLADALKCSFLRVAVSRASRKLGRFGDIYAVFVAPIDYDLVFVH